MRYLRRQPALAYPRNVGVYGGVGEHFLEVLSHVNTVHVVMDGLIVPVGQIVVSA